MRFFQGAHLDQQLELPTFETKGHNFSIDMYMDRTPPPIKFSTNPPTGDHVKKPFHAKGINLPQFPKTFIVSF